MISRVYLTGFMTSGKSTIGPILANSLGWNFFDLDVVIEKKEMMSVVEIFNEKGEDYFRKVETQTLDILSKSELSIISLGGGTIASKVNLDIMQKTGIIIYLKASSEQIYYRLKNKINRPLFRELVLNERPKEEFIEKISSLMSEREPYYLKADIIYDTENNSIGLTVDNLVKEINNFKKESK